MSKISGILARQKEGLANATFAKSSNVSLIAKHVSYSFREFHQQICLKTSRSPPTHRGQWVGTIKEISEVKM
jgi:hypothetical protein